MKPTKSTKAFAGWRTSDLADANEDLFMRRCLTVVVEPLKSYGGIASFHGPISTIKCFEDTSRVHEAVRESGLGRVLFIDGGHGNSKVIFGGSLARLAAENGWAGIIGLGFIRDVEEVRAQCIGVYALGSTPRRSDRSKNAGERDVILKFPYATVSPGDWVYADYDGILVSSTELKNVLPAGKCDL